MTRRVTGSGKRLDACHDIASRLDGAQSISQCMECLLLVLQPFGSPFRQPVGRI